MSNSSLVNYTKLSPNCSSRTGKISKITIHHMAGNLSVEACANEFQNTSRQASSNYGVGTDGRIGLYVEESCRAWTSSNRDNDNIAVTIEVANDSRDPDWHVSDKALESTIALCADICQRNGIAELNYTGDKSGNLTLHRFFASTLCPGPYLESKIPYIVSEVNKRLSTGADTPQVENAVSGGSGGVTYRVQAGAYGNIKSAEKQKKRLEDAGLSKVNIYSVDDTLYRVQIGGYATKAEAIEQQAKVINAGFSCFVTTLSGNVVGSATTGGITAGSVVMVKGNAPDYNGKSLASFVYERKHLVKSITGDRAVIVYNGIVVAAIHKDNLFLI